MPPPSARHASRRRWRSLRRRFNRWVTRVDLWPRLELAIGALVVVLGLSSYAIL
ncbi:MAG: hypothetical protein JO290_07465, partial [Sphingomonadaceae bacterium]|nr:hypothetical protein [Sphingomonadaceae bacterium]